MASISVVRRRSYSELWDGGGTTTRLFYHTETNIGRVQGRKKRLRQLANWKAEPIGRHDAIGLSIILDAKTQLESTISPANALISLQMVQKTFQIICHWDDQTAELDVPANADAERGFIDGGAM